MDAEKSTQGRGMRELPSVNALLERPLVHRLSERYGRSVVRESVQAALAELRDRMRDADNGLNREQLLVRAERIAARRARGTSRSTLRRVINATGVVIHTNLGRAPLSPVAARAAARAGQGYVALEYDLTEGKRGSRYVHCERLLCGLTGAEAALVVNNNAAALLLGLNTTAEGRGVLVSRGELVEIGGGFRVHEILGKSGARLIEVGATNKTHLWDYQNALRELAGDVGAVLKVHRSNFVQSGFVADVALGDLAGLLAGTGVPLIYDQGTGGLHELDRLGLTGEPTASDALQAGATLIAFSGDKLLGGPQAGILLGSRSWIQKARENPLTRALRVDKMTLAALEATLQLHRNPEHLRRLPVMELVARPVDELREAAARIADELKTTGELRAAVVDTDARVGGGSLPGADLPGVGVALEHKRLSVTELEAVLRTARTPVIGRIADGRLILDLRSVPEREVGKLVRIVKATVERAKVRFLEG
jgi:L-seryl-tRNA(Ser) seleniumtransferase